MSNLFRLPQETHATILHRAAYRGLELLHSTKVGPLPSFGPLANRFIALRLNKSSE
jgi:hypothetical protein